MNKEELKEQLVVVQSEINRIITRAILLSKDEITKLDHLYADMEELQFKIRLEENKDGAK